MKHCPAAWLAGLVLLVAPGMAPAMGFYALPPPTFREAAAASRLVVFGTLANPRGQSGKGSTDLIVTTVLKPDPLFAGKKVLPLQRYIPIEDPKRPEQWLVFCDVDKGKLDPYRGVMVGPAVVPYLRGLLALKPRDVSGRLRYCFNFLAHADAEIAKDAFQELRNASAEDQIRASRTLSPDKLRRWLQDPKTPCDRLSLYGLLLGCCGKPADAALLRGVAARLMKEEEMAEGVLIGRVLLDPKNGWAYVREVLGKRSGAFLVRFAALRAARVLFTVRPGVVAKKQLLEGLGLLLGQEDIADMVVGDLLDWRCWELTDRVLALECKNGFDTPLIRQAVLRYAFVCPRAEAARFVARQRKADAITVAEVEELLHLEAEARNGRSEN